MFPALRMFGQSRGIPKGAILLWSGSIASIPAGWQICNGSNGTPDLRDRFVVGAGTTYNPADTGGAINHNHPGSSPPHGHQIATNDFVKGSGSGASMYTDNVSVSVTVSNGDGRPPYFALAYIMKM